MNYKLERLPIIKGFIYNNIKMLEDRKLNKIDKEISRNLIEEEVECLIKDFLYTKLFGSTKQVLRFQSEMREIAEMLGSYLQRHHDKYISRVYASIQDII